MLYEDRGHHFSGQPITLMDMIWADGFARRGHAYGAPGAPAMFVFPNEAIMNGVRDGLDRCYSSIFPCQRFYCRDLECQEAGALCTSY